MSGGHVKFGADKLEDGRWRPYIELGIDVAGAVVNFYSDTTFDDKESAAAFMLEFYSILTEKAQIGLKLDPNGLPKEESSGH